MLRFFDIILAFIALVALSPLLLPVCLILMLTGEGEVFFRQERIGLAGKKFHLFKFATMLKDSPGMGTGTVTIKDDPRVLPFGRILRKTKINELPQLLNILLGQMSIVGPRPLTAQTFSAYPKAAQDAVVRVRPGLSGVGSVVFRNEEELLSRGLDSARQYSEVIAPYKGDLEMWFVNNQGVYVYFACIIATIVAVIAPKREFIWAILPNLPRPPENLRDELIKK